MDKNTLLRVVLELIGYGRLAMIEEFLHSVANDGLPTFNNVVGDLAQYLYIDSASDARDDVRYDDARDYAREIMMLEMMPEIMLEMIP